MADALVGVEAVDSRSFRRFARPFRILHATWSRLTLDRTYLRLPPLPPSGLALSGHHRAGRTERDHPGRVARHSAVYISVFSNTPFSRPGFDAVYTPGPFHAVVGVYISGFSITLLSSPYGFDNAGFYLASTVWTNTCVCTADKGTIPHFRELVSRCQGNAETCQIHARDCHSIYFGERRTCPCGGGKRFACHLGRTRGRDRYRRIPLTSRRHLHVRLLRPDVSVTT